MYKDVEGRLGTASPRIAVVPVETAKGTDKQLVGRKACRRH